MRIELFSEPTCLFVVGFLRTVNPEKGSDCSPFGSLGIWVERAGLLCGGTQLAGDYKSSHVNRDAQMAGLPQNQGMYWQSGLFHVGSLYQTNKHTHTLA